jgi:lysophospholipase L1-like esterase
MKMPRKPKENPLFLAIRLVCWSQSCQVPLQPPSKETMLMKSLPRRAFLCTLAASCVLIALTSTSDAQRQPDGKNTAVVPAPRDGGWMKRHESFNERAKKGDVDLVFIGDSITQGWEGAGKEAWKKHYGNRKAMNLGIGGDRTQHVLWRLENGNIEGIKPKLAVVMIGTNNSNGNDYTADQISDGIKAIVGKLRDKLPETKILLLAVFPRGAMTDAQIEKKAKQNAKKTKNVDEVTKEKIAEAREATKNQRKKLAAVNQTVSKLADNKSIYYLDIGSKFLQSDDTLPDDVMPDYLHLSPKGYEIWAEAIEPKVAELLGEKK